MFTSLRVTRLCVHASKKITKSLRFFYDSYSRHDTIFAPATPTNSAKGTPLGVVRVSGSKTKEVVELLTGYKIAHDEQLFESSKVIKPRSAKLVKFRNPITNEIIDQGLVLWFNKPHSYTGEDVCEFHLHGARSVMETILRTLAQINNLRSAEAGEFTRRAYLNGKLSIIQAESLKDLIESRTDHQRKIALSGLTESTVEKYLSWSELLVNTLAHIEASIDFGEDSSLNQNSIVANCIAQIDELMRELSKFISISSRRREALDAGFRVVILGKPNSGKSTMMNLLCGYDKSIVSSLSGTTRDVIEHSIELGGHLLVLSDTAGLKEFETNQSKSWIESVQDNQILEQHELVEKEGIKRALREARKADIVFFMVDGSQIENMDLEVNKILSEIKRVLKMSEMKPDVSIKLLVNKIDCNEKLRINNFLNVIDLHLKQNQMNIEPYLVSCKTQENVDSLLQDLTKQLDNMSLLDEQNTSEESLNYVNSRHLSLLQLTLRHLEEALELDPHSSIDRIAQHLREAVDYLSRISGEISNEQVIDVIFKDFCIGK